MEAGLSSSDTRRGESAFYLSSFSVANSSHSSGFGHDKSRTTQPYRELPGGGPTLFFALVVSAIALLSSSSLTVLLSFLL